MSDKEKLFMDNQKLVCWVFNKYLYKTVEVYNWKEDIHQEGFLGLWKACLEYNKEMHNVKFNTFAFYYIYGYMRNFITRIVIDYPRWSFDSIIRDFDGDEMVLSDTISSDFNFDDCNNNLSFSTDVDYFVDTYFKYYIYNKKTYFNLKLILIYISYGFSYRAIGEILGISKQRVQQLLKKLQKVCTLDKYLEA